MKNLLVILILLIFTFQANASHLMGGEITWQCQGNGQYIFTLKIYRDCNGLPINGTQETIRVHNHPTLFNITVNLVSQTDISPSCSGGGPSTTCATGGPGAIEEFVYVSGPVTISGTPPPQGWVFTFSTCCRNGAIDNIQNPAGSGFTLRSFMYNYSGFNTNPCFDSSPDFLESPALVVCAGSSFTYNHNANDQDLDSLVFSFGQPLDDINGGQPFTSTNPQPLLYESGYNVNSPLPSTFHNSSNVPATINSSTGEITFTSFTIGSFVSVIRVDSYKCGQLVATVYRELQMEIVACGANDIPIVRPPFQDQSGNFTSFADTVYAGELVSFQYTAFDDPSQTMNLVASGSQFGASFVNPNSGCQNPPCAILGPPPLPSIIGQDSVQTNFQWQTDCNHLSSAGLCASTSNTYVFLFSTQDDFCPTAGYNFGTVSVTVIAPPNHLAPDLRCAEVIEPTGDVNLSWAPVTDSLDWFYSYDIYASNDLSGPYTLIDSVMNVNTTTYTHTGAAANVDTVFYVMKTRSGCNGVFESDENTQDTLATMYLDAQINSGATSLNWNAMTNPVAGTTSGYYQIYKNTNGAGFTFLDSTLNVSYTDVQPDCGDTVVYKIELEDNLTCTSISSFDTVFTSNGFALDFNATGFCLGDTTFFNMTVLPNNVTSLNWDFGDGTTSTGTSPAHVFGSSGVQNVQVVVETALSCTDSLTEVITIFDLPDASISNNDTTICFSDSIQINGVAQGTFSWNTNAGMSNDLITNPMISPSVSTTYILSTIDMNTCTNADTFHVTIQNLPTITLVDTLKYCVGSSAQTGATSSGNNFSWMPATDISNASILNPIISTESNGYYYLTASDLIGCENTDSVFIELYSLPNINLGTDTSICLNEQFTINSGFISSEVDSVIWTPLNSTIPSQGVSVTTSITNSTEIIATVYDLNGCVNSDSILVTVNNLPSISTSGDVDICIGDSVQVSATANQAVTWSPVNLFSDPLSSNPDVTALVDTYLVVTTTDVNQCSNADSLLLSVNLLPSLTVSNDTAICIGDTIGILAMSGSPVIWDADPSLSATNVQNPLVDPNSDTYYYVSTTDGNSCTSSDSILVNVNPLPALTVSNDTSICEGDTITVNATSSFQVAWYSSASLSDTSISNPNVFPITTTDFIVETTDGNSCTSLDTVTVTVNSIPTLTLSVFDTICIFDTIQITATSGSPVVWVDNGYISNVNINNPMVYPDTTSYFQVSTTDANQCTNSDSLEIVVNPLPNVMAGDDFWICPGDDFDLLATGATDYTWSPSIPLSNANIPNPSGTSEDSLTMVVSGIDNNGCVNTDTLEIFANKDVPVDAGMDQIICFGDSVMIGGNPTSVLGTSFDWSPGIYAGDSIISNPMVSPPNTQNFIIIATNDTCTGTDTVQVEVLPLPIISISNDTAMCINDTITLSASGGASYSWVGDDILTDQNLANIDLNPTVTGYYVVTVTDINNCSNLDSALVTINALPAIGISNDTTLCIGDSALLVATGGTSYVWNSDNAITTNPLNDSITALPSTDGYYYVMVTDANSCSNSDTVLIEMYALPNVAITGVSDICVGDTALLAASGANSYIWFGNSITTSTGDEIGVYPSNDANYMVIGTDVNNCRDTATASIVVNSYPAVAYSLDSVFNCEGIAYTFINTNSGSTATWDVNGVPNVGEIYTETLEFGSDNVVSISINENNCVSNEQINISIDEFWQYTDIVVPNVFTPNGDGDNDVYRLIMKDELRSCAEISIYNRWGQLVYNNVIPSGWDGTINGKDANEGLYYVVIDVKGKKFESSINLIR